MNLDLSKTSIPNSPQDFEILDLCPVGPVLPHGEKVPLQPWFATPLSVMIKMPYGVDVLH